MWDNKCLYDDIKWRKWGGCLDTVLGYDKGTWTAALWGCSCQSDTRDAYWVTNEWFMYTALVHSLDEEMIHVQGWIDCIGKRFHHATQNGTQLKT